MASMGELCPKDGSPQNRSIFRFNSFDSVQIQQFLRLVDFAGAQQMSRGILGDVFLQIRKVSRFGSNRTAGF